MVNSTRGLGAGIHQATLDSVKNASSHAKVTLNPSEVKGLQAGLAAMANHLIDEFKALKSAGKTAEAGKLLQEQTVGAAIDKFVIDANKGDIALPAGVKATEVVSDAVAAFLKAGFTYSIDFQPMVGSHEMTASLEGGKVHWDESTGR